MKKVTMLTIGAMFLTLGSAVSAEDYEIDTKGAHAFIQFKIAHLGYSWLYGRFNTFTGDFSYDEKNPSASKVNVKIDTASLDSNHAERDKHLRGPDFLDVKKYPEATFNSTQYTENADGSATLVGDFSFHGVTKEISIDVAEVGAGDDPWGGYRRGFSGNTKFKLKDFGIDYDLGPASEEVELILSLEGIRK